MYRLLFIILFCSLIFSNCKQDDTNVVFDLGELEIEANSFQEIELSSSSRIILNGVVAKNRMYFVSSSLFYFLEVDLTREGAYFGGGISLFRKPTIAKNYVIFAPVLNDEFISLHHHNDFLTTETNLPIWKVGDTTNTVLEYSKYNTSAFDYGAVNDNNKGILPLIKQTDTNAIVFIQFAMDDIVKYYYNNTPPDYLTPDKYSEIILPTEFTSQINRIESFRDKFYISTKWNTYLLREDGTFKLIASESANDFFLFEDRIYADYESWIGVSDDNGETWKEINNISTFDGFREFQEVHGQLMFFHEDDLYLVDPNDFSFTLLRNAGMEGSKITSILPFSNQIYIATLSGLFYKPIENL